MFLIWVKTDGWWWWWGGLWFGEEVAHILMSCIFRLHTVVWIAINEMSTMRDHKKKRTDLNAISHSLAVSISLLFLFSPV